MNAVYPSSRRGPDLFALCCRPVRIPPPKIEVKEIDIRNYAKYLLLEASDPEKRELLGCLKSKILLANKIVSVQ